METRLDRYEGARELKIRTLRELISESDKIVFLGGAGVSTESGIPDFRSGDGIYNQESGLNYRPVDIISHSFFMEHTEEFYDFYRRKLLYPNAKPNKAHKALVRLERQGKLMAIVTQNIDKLHQDAGSKCTIELHGSVFRNHCMDCGKKFPLKYILEHEGVPHCDRCGGIIRPDITLYEENLEHDKVDAAIKAIKKCDLLIIGGTSLTVYPAATFSQFVLCVLREVFPRVSSWPCAPSRPTVLTNIRLCWLRARPTSTALTRVVGCIPSMVKTGSSISRTRKPTVVLFI